MAKNKSKISKHLKTLELYQLKADHQQLKHIHTYDDLPKSYKEKHFECVDCGIQQVWSARSQKHYYEVVKGHINATAIRCKACRYKRKKAINK